MCISEIAVMTGSDGRTIPLNEAGTVVVFRRALGAWQADRTLQFAPDEADGLTGLRRKMAELVTFLGQCRSFVAASAGGAAFFELEKARCQVWEIPGCSPDMFLDTVWRNTKEEQEASAQLPADDGIPAPREISPGKFTVSIKDIQGRLPGVSSKQVLMQFIRMSAFAELAITCDHLPPWIEVEAERLGISIETEYPAPHEMRVILRKLHEGACC